MRISDWSSDVCSSDLLFRGRIDAAARLRNAGHVADRRLPLEIFQLDADALVLALGAQRFFAVAADIAFALEHVENTDAQRRSRRPIGSASGRERVCAYV